MNTPIGAVMPFFLNADEVKKLAPYWLPTDGSIVNDAESRFHNSTLPDLRGKVIYGASVNEIKDLTNGVLEGGSHDIHLQGDIKLTSRFKTENAKEHDLKCNKKSGNPLGCNPKGYFLTDTRKDESGWAQHTHEGSVNIQGKVDVSGRYDPPYRKLIYMIKVR